jgi:hypothetical protein
MTSSTLGNRSSDAREERGRQIASSMQIRKERGRWVVPSQSCASERYLVNLEAASCTCPDFKEHGGTCKHQHAVLFWIAWGRDVGAAKDVAEAATKPPPMKRKAYPPKSWSAYNASQVHERTYFERLLGALCEGIPQPTRKSGPGRPRLPIGSVVFSAIMKVYSTMSARRVQSDLFECARRGNLGHLAHYNSISNFFMNPETTPLLELLVEESSTPLRLIENGRFSQDSSGFSTCTYERWFDQKHGKLFSKHEWLKLHVMVGTVTNAIVSARVTPQADVTQLPELLERGMRRFDVRELSADAAYSSVRNYDVLERCGVEAFIPFKVNAVMNPKAPEWSNDLALFVFYPDRFNAHYAFRNNVEATFASMKQKFGGAVASRDPIARINELLGKAVAHNLCCVVKAIFMSGLAPTFWPDATSPIEPPIEPATTSATPCVI